MTRRAIQILNPKSKGKKKGFFLQVEAADPDKGAHRADPCWSMGGIIDLNEAVKVGLEFAKKNPRTLLIVTGDHGQSAQIIPFAGASKSAILTTNEGSTMVLGYATSRFRGSGACRDPGAAQGPGSAGGEPDGPA